MAAKVEPQEKKAFKKPAAPTSACGDGTEASTNEEAEGEMEGVEGEDGENTSLKESLDVKWEGEGANADDGDDFGAEELVGDGVDMGDENDEGADISWVEELWKKKKEEAKKRKALFKKEEQPVEDIGIDFEMKDESEERTDSAQKEQLKDLDELKMDDENKATAERRETEGDTTVPKGPEKFDNPEWRMSWIKQGSCIPRAYFGPAFDENLFQCCVRIYPVVYAELVYPDFAELLMGADIVRMKLGSRYTQRSLELYCQKSIDMVRKLMTVPQSFSAVTIEVERRQATGWKNVVQNEQTYNVPTGFSSDKIMTVKFNVKKAYFRQNLSTPIPVDNGQSLKERSLFLNNLPQKVEGILLKHVFPLASKIDVVNVSESMSSAVLTMKSWKMVVHHLVAVTDVCINGQVVEMGAVDTTQEAELLRYEHQRRYEKQQNRNRRQPFRSTEQKTDVGDTSSVRNDIAPSSSKAGSGEGTGKPSPEEQKKRDQERKEKEKKDRELKEKQRREKEKRDREQREKMQKEKERQREQVQKDRLESSRQQKDDEKTKSRKRELAQKEFSRMKKDARNAYDTSPRTGSWGARSRQQSGAARKPWESLHAERMRKRGMDREMEMHREREMRGMDMWRDLELAREMEMKELELRREMEMQREMEIQRDLAVEQEMHRQREIQQELEQEMERKREYEMAEERKRHEQWEWEKRQRQKTLEEQVRQKEEEKRERHHQEELLREKEKMEKMHQNAMLKLMMVEEQQRRERDQLQRREQEMAAENKRLQQKLAEEKRRQQQEKDKWEEQMSRKRGRFEEPGAMGPELGGMAGKRGRGGGFYAPDDSEPVSEESMKRKLEQEVARQAEELKKSLAILDKIQKDPAGISSKDKAHGAQPSPAFKRPEQASQHGYSQGQDYGRDMSHFQYPHAGVSVTAIGEGYDSQYGALEPAPTTFSPTSAWGAGAMEAGSWLPQADLQTGGYSQAPRQWINSQRQGGQQAGDQGQQRAGQGGQRKDGGYQQLARRGADSNQTGKKSGGYEQPGRQQESAYSQAARQGGFTGGNAQAKRQGGGSYGQAGGSNYGQRNTRGSGGGGGAHGGGQGRAGNY